MPKTFRDAVLITRELGIRYFWIDSLCISQDDGKDWECESSKMASIYMNSYLNISAMSAAYSGEGCFHQLYEIRIYTDFPLRTQSGTEGIAKAFLVPIVSATDVGEYIRFRDEPLTKRVWAFQEKLLAPRSLYLGSDQMRYKCKEGLLSEDGYNCRGDREVFNGLGYKYLTDEILDEITKAVGPPRGYGLWHDIVRRYATLELTNSSDKLPALSGLARYFEETRDNIYIAGLWQKSLMEGILWQSMGNKPSRPPIYQAPSWSWASIDGPLALVEIGRFEDISQIVSSSTTLKSDNRYGEILDGRIEIRAPLIPVIFSALELPEEQKRLHEMAPRLRTPSGDPKGFHVMFDVASDRETAKVLELFILVFVWEKEFENVEDRTYEGLIVSPVKGEDNCFRRLGKAIPCYQNLKSCKELEYGSDSLIIILV